MTRRRVVRRSVVALLACAFVAGCSADSVDEPLPSIETPGAFVARAKETGGYRLFRTRTYVAVDSARTYVFFDEHPPGAESLEDATAKARDPALSLAFIGPILLSQFQQQPYRVVWYRSMTDEERGANGGF